MRLPAIILASVLVAAACGGDDHNNGDGGGGSGSDQCINTAGPPLAAPQVTLGTNVKLTKLLTLDGNPASALLVTAPPNDGRLFVLQQSGQIRIIEDGVLKPEPFLDLDSVITAEAPPGERGLLGLAFHPNYACNGVFFVDYTTSDADVVARYTVSQADINKADPTSGEVVLSIPDPFENHNGGMLEFGNTDGLLYISIGDGGSANDPRLNGQAILRTDPTCMANHCEPLLAKLLRIDVDHPANGKNYGIPSANPYASGGGEPEILLRGLRNPWRWSFDRMTGDMWIGDVGQDLYEELDVIPAAQINGTPGHPLNLGWSIYEGNHTFKQNGNDCNGNGTCSNTGLVMPLFERDHQAGGDNWHAVIGGQVYRGQNYPGLAGQYYFTDNSKAPLVQATYNAMGPSLATTEIAGVTMASPSSVHADAAGELWLTDTAGNIYQIQATP